MLQVVFLFFFCVWGAFGSSDIPPLHLSVIKGDYKGVTKLLESGVDLNEKMRDGSSALHLAVWAEKMDLVKLLLSHQIDLELGNGVEQTALHVAVNKASAELVILLIGNLLLKLIWITERTSTHKTEMEPLLSCWL